MIEFMKHRYTFWSISIALIVVSLVLIAVKGLNYGIHFRGGSIIQVRFNQDMNETSIRAIFNEIDQEHDLYFSSDQIIVQSVAGIPNREFIIQYPAPLADTARAGQAHDIVISELRNSAPFAEDALETATVGPTVGEEMRRSGMLAALFSIIGILLYLAYRFELQSATGAIGAIVHDLILTLGFLTLIGLEFDVTVLAAVLTLLGYSVNDSIVILDRIRENRKITKDHNFVKLIDVSINQTLARTINTSLTTLIALLALLIMGGVSIYGFALTLTFGMLVGTYSSLFIASPILLELTGTSLKQK